MNDLIENATLLMTSEDYPRADWKPDETVNQMHIYTIDPSYCEGDTPLFI